MRNKTLLIPIVAGALSLNLFAWDLPSNLPNIGIGNTGAIVDKAKDAVFGTVKNKAFGFLGGLGGDKFSACYVPANDYVPDVCHDIDNIIRMQKDLDVCALLPDIPGFNKKRYDVGLKSKLNRGLAELTSMCSRKKVEFEKTFDTTIAEGGQYIKDTTAPLPNGKSVKQVDDMWSDGEFKTAIKANKPSLFMKAIRDGDQDVLRDMMSLTKVADIKDLNSIDIPSLKASKNLTEYKEDREKIALTYSDSKRETMPSNISSAVAHKLASNPNLKGEAASKAAGEVAGKAKEQIKLARANDIAVSLELARRKGDYAIPTQDVVEIVREDLRPKMVAEMKAQKMREAMVMAQVNERWDRREALIDLLAQKEVILNEPFDEDGARKEIERIASSK